MKNSSALMKLAMIGAILLLTILVLTGCHPIPVGADDGSFADDAQVDNEMEMYGPFVIVAKGFFDSGAYMPWYILVDPETDVLYYCEPFFRYSCSFITPLYNADGTLKLRSK